LFRTYGWRGSWPLTPLLSTMPPRRSSRTSAGALSALEGTSAESTTQNGKRPPKKQHKTQNVDPPAQTSKRGRGGKLRKLTEMPLDILFEVWGYFFSYKTYILKSLLRFSENSIPSMCLILHDLRRLCVIFSCDVLLFLYGRRPFPMSLGFQLARFIFLSHNTRVWHLTDIAMYLLLIIILAFLSANITS